MPSQGKRANSWHLLLLNSPILANGTIPIMTASLPTRALRNSFAPSYGAINHEGLVGSREGETADSVGSS